jgi:hypothetical protein
VNEHVVDYQDSGHPEGMIALLQPHRRGEPRDWTSDGLTCDPDLPCAAIAEVTKVRCAKREAVVLLPAVRTKYARPGSGTHDVHLCGGHFNSHRAGKAIRVIVTPARAQ